jgi:hypothetical protein
MFKIFIIQFLLFSISYANELKLYVITPKAPIIWASPQTLAITTGLNSITKDYAPIGHFAVEVNCENSNRFGVKHVLTGMERENKKESQKITLNKKLGLGSLIYPFEGALQSAKATKKDLIKAKIDGRLKIIRIPTTTNRCQQMLGFLEDWIKHGAFTIYGGAKNTAEGEGAGCADFAMEFFKMATNRAVPAEWMAQVNVPKRLMGDGLDKKVDFSEILKTMTWETSSEGFPYKIADTNKVDMWLPKNLVKKNGVYFYDAHLKENLSENYQLPAMRYFYYRPAPERDYWRQISNY